MSILPLPCATHRWGDYDSDRIVMSPADCDTCEAATGRGRFCFICLCIICDDCITANLMDKLTLRGQIIQKLLITMADDPHIQSDRENWISFCQTRHVVGQKAQLVYIQNLMDGVDQPPPLYITKISPGQCVICGNQDDCMWFNGDCRCIDCSIKSIEPGPLVGIEPNPGPLVSTSIYVVIKLREQKIEAIAYCQTQTESYEVAMADVLDCIETGDPAKISLAFYETNPNAQIKMLSFFTAFTYVFDVVMYMPTDQSKPITDLTGRSITCDFMYKDGKLSTEYLSLAHELPAKGYHRACVLLEHLLNLTPTKPIDRIAYFKHLQTYPSPSTYPVIYTGVIGPPLVGIEPNPGPSITDISCLLVGAAMLFRTSGFHTKALIIDPPDDTKVIKVQHKKHLLFDEVIHTSEHIYTRRRYQHSTYHFIPIDYVTYPAPAPLLVGIEPNPGPLSDEQEIVLKHAKDGQSFYLGGKAGCGKSFTLKEIINSLPAVSVSAMTGAAAQLIGGRTMHSVTGIGDGSGSVEDIVKKMKAIGKAFWRGEDALIVDEISMMDGELFEKLDGIAKVLRLNNKFMGGKQIMFFGDLHQLPPVDKFKNKRFVFDSLLWSNMKEYMLTQNFRQQGDVKLKLVLDEVRDAKLTAVGKAILVECQIPKVYTDGIEPTDLYNINKDVDRVNNERLAALPGQVRLFTATDMGIDKDKLDKGVTVAARLELKELAKVVLLQNMSDSNVFNGSTGIITSFTPKGLPVVKFTNGVIVTLSKLAFPYKNNRGKETASRQQIPLRLSWATTVHKSQGQTLDRIRVQIDNAFENGQIYTALSRATSLAGIEIQGEIDYTKIRVHPLVAEFSARLAKNPIIPKLKRKRKEEEEGVFKKPKLPLTINAVSCKVNALANHVPDTEPLTLEEITLYMNNVYGVMDHVLLKIALARSNAGDTTWNSLDSAFY